MAITKQVEPGAVSARVVKRFNHRSPNAPPPPAARVLPLPAREILTKAASSPSIGRAAEIDRAIKQVRSQYPQFFTEEK